MGILTVVILFGVYTKYFGGSSDAQTNSGTLQTTQVTKGDIRQTIKVLGKAELVDEQQLRFNQAGKIAAVYFKDGDTVKKDQIIAELDKTDVENDIKQAEISLDNSRLTLQELLKGNTDVDILKAKNDLLDTKKKIEVAQKNLEIATQDEKNTLDDLDKEIVLAEKDVSEKVTSLQSAQKNLENTTIFEGESIKSSTNTYQASLDDALLTAKDALSSADDILNKIDAVLGIEENTKKNNDAFERYLGFNDIKTLNIAKTSYSLAREKRKELQTAYDTLESDEESTVSDAIVLLQAATDMFQALSDAASDTYAMLQETITGSNLTSSSLDSMKSSVSSARSSAQSGLGSIKSDLTNLKNLESLDITELRSSDTLQKAQDSVQSAQYSLDKSEDTLRNLKSGLAVKQENARLTRLSKENDLASLQNTLDVQEKQLAELERGETEERIALAKNDISQKELALSKVQKNVEKYELRAPFDGILRKIDFQVGDNLVADEDKYVYIENPDLLRITISLDQIDIVKVKVGYQVKIVFDALPEKEFWGEIGEIDQTPVEQSGVVSYEASIVLQKEDETIFSGMTASLEVIIQEKTDILLAPNLSLTTRGGNTYVQKVVNGIPQDIEVETGVTDGRNTEILSGLQEGDEIVEASFQSQGGIGGSASPQGGANGQDTMRQFMRATGGGGGGGRGN